MAQGGNGSVTVTLTRGGGFEGAVALTITGLPTGVTTSFVPAELTGATVSATVNVAVASTAALGTHTATITATGQGVGQATATYQLTITTAPDFALSVTPAALTIVAGSDNVATVNIARTSFAGPVMLSLLQPPTGITGGFGQNPATSDGSPVTVGVAASVAPGTYPLTLQGTGGPGNRTTTLTVTVPAPPAGGNVQYEFCDPAEAPVFVGYQDGTGPWQTVTGATSGGTTRYTLNLTQTRGGVMFVYPPAANVVVGIGRILGRQTTASRSSGTRLPALLENAFVTQILYGTTIELAQDGTESCALTQPRKTITGTVAGVPPGAYGIVSAGGSAAEIFDGAAPSNPITFTGVKSGPFDVVGTRTIPGSAPSRTFVLRNLNLASGGSLPSTIDFNGTASAAPATASVTITGGAGDDLEAFVDLVTANGVGGFWFDLSPSTTATRPWGGLASMMAGDLHSLVVFAAPADNFTDFRVAVKHVGPVANQSMALGPVITLPAASQVAGGAYPRFRFQGVLPAAYNKGASIDVLGVAGSGNVLSILATGGWLAAAGNPLAYDFTMPDVAGLAGFPAGARLTTGTNDLAAAGWGFTGAGVFDVRPALGSELKAAIRGSTLVVP